MKFLRSLDLYKVIVLLSLVLLPVGYLLVRRLDESILACKRTITEATRDNGLLEQIGALQRKVEIVDQNDTRSKVIVSQPRTYFEGQILGSAASGANLKTSDFAPNEAPSENGVLQKGKQPITDHIVAIDWTNKDRNRELTVTLDFVYSVIFNCESGARSAASAGAADGQRSIWKLRELELVNMTDEQLFSRHRTPPAEISDKWKIKQMKFARREPRKVETRG